MRAPGFGLLQRQNFWYRSLCFAGRARRPSPHRAVLLACPGGGVGARPPHSQTGLPTSALGSRRKAEVHDMKGFGAWPMDQKPGACAFILPGSWPSHLWLGPAAGLPSLFDFPPHSRGVKFHCLGLQTYSCRLCMSRGKHH